MRFTCPFCRMIVAVDNTDLGTDVQCGQCGEVVTVPISRVGSGSVIGDFIILDEIGRGGMGVVYLAHQISLDRPAAVKILADHYANNAEFVVNFIKEARAAAKLNHPHIVQAYAVGEDEGIYYFAMENIDGETMKSVLKREKVIGVEKAVTIIQQIAEALDYAWKEQKLVHRDIKPDNIMMTRNNRAKLADLGLSRVAGEIEDSEDDEVMGTPQYISPEHLTGAPMDVRSDIYSLGATFYHFLTGRFPFEGRTATEIARKHLEEQLIPPNLINPDVPESVGQIVEKMMQKNVKDRYQDAQELIDDLRLVRRGKAPASAGKTTTSASKVVVPKEASVKLKRKTVITAPVKGFSTRQMELGQEGAGYKTKDYRTQDFVGPDGTVIASINKSAATYKMAFVVLSVVLLLVIAAGIVGFLYLSKSGKKHEPAPAVAPAAPVTPAPATPAPAVPPTPAPAPAVAVSELVREIDELVECQAKNQQSPTIFLIKYEEFLNKKPTPSGDVEKGRLDSLAELALKTEEGFVREGRKTRHEAHEKFIAGKRADEAKALEDKRKADDAKRREDERLANIEKETKEKAAALKSKQDQYKKTLLEMKDSMSGRYVDYVRRKSYKEAREIFNQALGEPARIKGSSSEEEKDAAELADWAKKMQDGVDMTEKLAKILDNSVSEVDGLQVELRQGALGKITKIANGVVSAKMILSGNVEEMPLSSMDPANLRVLVKKIAKKCMDEKAAFFYFLNNGEFSAAKDIAPDGDWKKDASDVAHSYFLFKLKYASDSEKASLGKEYGRMSEFKKARKTLSPSDD